jgi:hypothetical protein
MSEFTERRTMTPEQLASVIKIKPIGSSADELRRLFQESKVTMKWSYNRDNFNLKIFKAYEFDKDGKSINFNHVTMDPEGYRGGIYGDVFNGFDGLKWGVSYYWTHTEEIAIKSVIEKFLLPDKKEK